jgi:hypothetical protein
VCRLLDLLPRTQQFSESSAMLESLSPGMGFSGSKYVVMVSRRAAGVWTHLPSLTFMLMSKLEPRRPILWVDFGLRYEMLNHLLIDPARFPQALSLIGLLSRSDLSGPIEKNDLMAYSQTIAVDKVAGAEAKLSEIQGEDPCAYCEYVDHLRLKGIDAFLLPIQVPSLQKGGLLSGLNVSDVEKILSRIERELQPAFIFLTFEGQPEAKIFAKKVEEDHLLNWSLDKATIILCLVRFDSKQRFEDSVAIPTHLSRSPGLKDRLRLILTRCIYPPFVQPELERYLLGTLPFANFVGESVNNGRIPVIDIWSCQHSKEALAEGQENYLKSLGLLSEQLIKTSCSGD